jgi:hypothetical protein
LRLSRDGDQLQDHVVPCSDAVADGPNHTRVRMIRGVWSDTGAGE